MKILHIHLNGPFTEGWSYQENQIPRLQKKLGHDVFIIANTSYHLEDNSITNCHPGISFDQDGIKIYRIANSTFNNRYKKIFRNYRIKDIVSEIKPDFIMVHGLMGSVSPLQLRSYLKKNKHTIAVVDTHQDFYNTPMKNTLLYKLYRLTMILLNRVMIKYYRIVYYVAPTAKEYAIKFYKIPAHKLEILPLGCNEENLINLDRDELRTIYANKLGFEKTNIIFCHGGKLNKEKRTIELIDSFLQLKMIHPNVVLLLFGSMSQDVKNIFENIGEAKNIYFLGMLKPEEYNKILYLSDINVFPGTQSSLWQESISSGTYTILRYYPDNEYLNIGLNVEFISEDKILNAFNHELLRIYEERRYLDRSSFLTNKARDFFSYQNISKRILKIK